MAKCKALMGLVVKELNNCCLVFQALDASKICSHSQSAIEASVAVAPEAFQKLGPQIQARSAGKFLLLCLHTHFLWCPSMTGHQCRAQQQELSWGRNGRPWCSGPVPDCSYYSPTTLCLKKVPTFKVCVILSNLNRFSKFLYCWKAYEICYKTHTTLPTSPQECCYTTL